MSDGPEKIALRATYLEVEAMLRLLDGKPAQPRDDEMLNGLRRHFKARLDREAHRLSKLPCCAPEEG